MLVISWLIMLVIKLVNNVGYKVGYIMLVIKLVG